jgi:excisionase family DNA binding protein
VRANRDGLLLEELRASGRATITVNEAAELLGVSRGVAYRAAKRGELPGVLSLGRRYVISVPALLAALGAVPGQTPPDVRPGPSGGNVEGDA